MKRASLRIIMLLSLTWILYANFHVLGSAADAISRTNREVAIKLEMQQIAALVKVDYIDTGKLPPNPAQLYRDALRADQREPSDQTGRDRWGNYYRLLPSPRGFYLISAGPDGNYRSKEDNIQFHQALVDVGYTGDIYRKWRASVARRRKSGASARGR